jgi:hypothetical protein
MQSRLLAAWVKTGSGYGAAACPLDPQQQTLPYRLACRLRAKSGVFPEIELRTRIAGYERECASAISEISVKSVLDARDRSPIKLHCVRILRVPVKSI